MFLHLGGVTIIDMKEMIAVLNLEKIDFIEEWIKQSFPQKHLVDISEGKPKSAVFTDEKVILSPISSFTLKKRLKQIPV